MRLALCEAVDADGVFSRHLDRDLLNALVHLATLTEHLYAVPAKDAAISLEKDQAGSIVREDTAPLLTDCITPRALNRAVQDSEETCPDATLTSTSSTSCCAPLTKQDRTITPA